MKIKRYKKDESYSYTLGMTLTFELLKFRPTYTKVVYIHSLINKNEHYKELINLCNTHKVEVLYNDKMFNVLSQKENCFVIGVFDKFDTSLLSNEPHILLVNPSNCGNLGTIIRSSLGFNVRNLAIISPACDIFDPKTIRASMGSIFSMNFSYFKSFEEYSSIYNNHSIYPFMLNAKHKLQEVSFEDLFTLTFGNEATGLPDEFLDIGESVIIPHSNNIDSLNITIAASIALYQATKNNF